jgi:2-polyprenyl-3-methyl-5-hydroxy-6-metoxy-1,4-benzoquinol methylase
MGRAYERYYTHDGSTHDTNGATPTRRVREALRNGYVNATLGYSLRPAVPCARLLVGPFPIKRRRAQRLVRNLPRRDGGRLLDVGCGHGSLLATMHSNGWIAEGVEPDRRAAAKARANGSTVHVIPFEEADFSPSSFDAITMNHVLEHLAEPLAALRRCRELLSPGGLLWAATPNLASPGHRTYSVDWMGLDAPRHLVLWTPESLGRALDEAGFDVTYLEPFDAAWMLRESEQLRAGRVGRLHSAGLSLRGRVRDLRALRDPRLGEELVVLARAREN